MINPPPRSVREGKPRHLSSIPRTHVCLLLFVTVMKHQTVLMKGSSFWSMISEWASIILGEARQHT